MSEHRSHSPNIIVEKAKQTGDMYLPLLRLMLWSNAGGVVIISSFIGSVIHVGDNASYALVPPELNFLKWSFDFFILGLLATISGFAAANGASLRQFSNWSLRVLSTQKISCFRMSIMSTFSTLGGLFFGVGSFWSLMKVPEIFI